MTDSTNALREIVRAAIETSGVGCVAPNHRRRGIARALINEISAWSTERGCVEMWLVTDPDNDEANAFYRSLGADRSDVVLCSIA